MPITSDPKPWKLSGLYKMQPALLPHQGRNQLKLWSNCRLEITAALVASTYSSWSMVRIYRRIVHPDVHHEFNLVLAFSMRRCIEIEQVIAT